MKINRKIIRNLKKIKNLNNKLIKFSMITKNIIKPQKKERKLSKN